MVHNAYIPNIVENALIMSLSQVTRRRIIRSLVYGVVGSGLGIIAAYISTLLDASDNHEQFSISLIGLIIGFILGLKFGLLEEFIWHRLSKKISHLPFLIIQLATYIFFIILWLIIAISFEHVITENMSFGPAMKLYLNEENFIRDIVFSAIMALLLIVFGRIRMLHYSRELFSLFSGKYYYPEEEIRTIMFVDLVGSTSIAEELGPLRYSEFLQDWFSFMSEAIFAWRGIVYQYVGDGFILSWRSKHEYSGQYPIKCFFDMQMILTKNKTYFQSKYDNIPSFRAGIHKGQVVTTWVGDRKKELAFHGDTINTAARIQSLCKEYNVNLLISKSAFDQEKIRDNYQLKKIGDVVPVGKTNSITLYSITRKEL